MLRIESDEPHYIQTSIQIDYDIDTEKVNGYPLIQRRPSYGLGIGHDMAVDDLLLDMGIYDVHRANAMVMIRCWMLGIVRWSAYVTGNCEVDSSWIVM